MKGEPKTSSHLGDAYRTGFFSIENAESDSILIRRLPDNEWKSIYRKSSLPPFDFSVDNCIRLELVPGIEFSWDDAIHAACGDGITDKAEIAAFLSDVRSQKDSWQAGLYDLAVKPNGRLENCYTYAVIYGFFAEEPNLAICMRVTSYNDLAYSVSIGEKEYVLPETWLQKFQDNEQTEG